MQVYGAGGKTTPKKGRLGTGSYYPEGTPLYQHKGNVFPGIHVEPEDFHQTSFGDQSRAGVATQAGQPRNQTQGIHPNKSQYNTITLPLAPATVPSSSNEANNLQPIPPSKEVLSMPHERNTNSASGTKKKPKTYRTAFGASRTMASDTAFQHDPGANYKHSVRQPPKPTVEAQKKTATIGRTFGQVKNSLPVRGGVNPKQQNRTPPPSFASHGNIWYDANNSFISGQDGGVGRWHMVKRGVV